MSAYLFNLVYFVALLAASPLLLWRAWRSGKYRAGFAEKFLGRVPRRIGQRPCVWLHAVSVGEVNLLAPLIAELARRRPDVECVISTTSRTGHELAVRKYSGHCVFYCPLDFTWAVCEVMRRIRPDALVLAELELWPNLIRTAKSSGARVAVVNGRLSERSFRRYRLVRPLVGGLLRNIDCLAVQTQEYADRFLALGAAPQSVHVAGSLKFDGAQTDRSNPATLRLKSLAGIGDDDVVFVAGSTQRPEEQLALDAYRAALAVEPRLRLIVVPRHPERFDEAARIIAASGFAWQRRSIFLPLPPGERRGEGDAHWQVLLVDTIGELGAWWGTADIAFVGGSFGARGGQNMIEPAAYGAAVCFGPNTWNFRDVVAALIHAHAAVVVRDGADLTDFVRRCVTDQKCATELGNRAAQLVAANLGATQRTVELLLPLLCESRDAITDAHAA